MPAVWFALGLLLLLVGVGLAFYWQGTIRLPGSAVSYGVEESIKYITPRLSEGTRVVIGDKSVRRILEWEMKYLQDSLDSGGDEAIVLGGEAARQYVLDMTTQQGFEYEPAIVDEVLRLQADYLASIGAIADPVDAGELDTIQQGEAGNG